MAQAPRLVDWFEILSDNFIGAGGRRRAMLERLRADYPLVLHGLSLSIAGTDRLNDDYIEGVRALADWLDPVWISDHLCWTALDGQQAHDLLPVAYTGEVLSHVTARVLAVQERLGRRLLLENPSAYVAFGDAEMSEAEFLADLCRRTGCGVLLDVNNLYVNAMNLGIDPAMYLAQLPDGVVGYVHVAGHAVLPDVRIDTHDADVPDPVWGLFAAAVRRFPDAGVIIERDDNVPAFAELVREVERARTEHAENGEGPSRQGSGRTGRRPVPPSISRVSSPKALGWHRPPAGAVAATPAADGAAPARWAVLQSQFWKRLVEPVEDDVGLLATVLDDTRPVAAARGMRVYRDAYAATVRRALATNFRALSRVLGRDDFDRLAAAYVRRHPPDGHDVRRLGAALPAFLRGWTFAADYGLAPAAFADLAALEQAQLEAADAIDEPADVTPASLAAIVPAQWDGVKFEFVRSVRFVRVTYDVLPAVEAVERDAPPPRPAAVPGAYLVSRVDGAVHTERVDEPVASVLEHLVAGNSFAAAWGGVANPPQDQVSAAVRVLLVLCARGAVRGLTDDAMPRSTSPVRPA